MKRTTVVIEDELLRKLRERAQSEGLSLKECINKILRIGIKAAEGRTPGKSTWKTFKMGKPLVDLNNRDILYHTMEEK